MSGEMACYRTSGTAKMINGQCPSGEGAVLPESEAGGGILNGVEAAYEYEVDARDNSHVRLRDGSNSIFNLSKTLKILRNATRLLLEKKNEKTS